MKRKSSHIRCSTFAKHGNNCFGTHVPAFGVHELRNANMFQFISFYEVLGEFLIKKWYLKWSKQWIKKPTTAATATTSLFISLYLSLWRVVLVAVWCGESYDCRSYWYNIIRKKKYWSAIKTYSVQTQPKKMKTTIKTMQIFHKFSEKKEHSNGGLKKKVKKMKSKQIV